MRYAASNGHISLVKLFEDIEPLVIVFTPPTPRNCSVSVCIFEWRIHQTIWFALQILTNANSKSKNEENIEVLHGENLTVFFRGEKTVISTMESQLLRSVLIDNIPYTASEEQLQEIFESVGPVLSLR